jgi:NAD(P)-dependent dehydrogenase (short-subunit alcohol dehydrogenase family)
MKKCIIITGSTSGIGRELVNQFRHEDCLVFCGYRNIDKLDKDLPDNIIPFYIDMKDRGSIIKAAEFIKSKTDKVDVLINVAGIVAAGAVELIDTDRLREQFEVNVFSHIEFSQKLVPVLMGGRIVNISSMSSFGNFPFISPYCASKRALDIFFNAFAIENHKNIQVVSIKPGVISTPIWQKSVESNVQQINECGDYTKEMEFLKNNALKNANKGLDVSKAAKFIKHIALKKRVKVSYTLGKDAFFAKIMSYLPQDMINKLVKYALNLRINHCD